MTGEAMAVVVGIVVLGAVVIGAVIIKLLYICGPNEVLVFSGARRRVGDKLVGYRSVKGGRKVKIPLFEVVDRVDLTNMVINVGVAGAFSKGGIPLNVDGVANVKIAGEEPLLGNAVERFLGMPRDHVVHVCRDTLEGNLRGVLARMTPEEVNADKITFAQKLMEEADHDLNRLGLVLDTLKIQNVSDERGYLDSIGRISSAEIRKQAVVAEWTSRAASMVKDAANMQETEVTRINAAVRTIEAQTKRQVADAQSREAALVAEEQGKIRAAVVEARAQLDVQRARLEQVAAQLEADVETPARAEMQAAIDRARGEASRIIEEGKATAQALTQITKTWREAGPNARDVFLMQKLQGLVSSLTRTLEAVKVDKVTVLGIPGGGNGAGNLATKIVGASEQLKAALGIDVLGALEQRLTGEAPGETPKGSKQQVSTLVQAGGAASVISGTVTTTPSKVDPFAAPEAPAAGGDLRPTPPPPPQPQARQAQQQRQRRQPPPQQSQR